MRRILLRNCDIAVDADDVFVLFIASNTYTGIHPELLQVVASGRLSGIENLITGRVSLDEVVEKGIKSLLTEKDKHGMYSFNYCLIC